jgi:hydroxymethylpyrimidine/phosphomethylpyrimidine kinase
VTDRQPSTHPGDAPPRALTIAGSDSGGGAGIQADLKTFLNLRVHGMSAITAITVQNSVGVSGVYELPPHAVAEQIEAVVTDIGVDAVKIGMLSSTGIIEAVAATLRRLAVPRIVVDPVAVSKHGDALLQSEAVAALAEQIFPLADLVTPNLGEVETFTGVGVLDRAGQAKAARAFLDLGPRWVLVKGGHLPTQDDAVDLLSDGSQVIELAHPRLSTEHTHGTGCTLSAAVAAALAGGASMPAAVRTAKDYVTAGIAGGYPLGKGIGPVGHFGLSRLAGA